MSHTFDTLVELKINVLLHGINFSIPPVRQYLNNHYLESKIQSPHGLFLYHDSNEFIPNEIVVKNQTVSIRIETRSNINSNYYFDIENNEIFLKNKSNNKKYKTNFVYPPDFYGKISPRGFALSKYITTMGTDCLRIYPKLNCDFEHTEWKCKFCGINCLPSPLSDDDLMDEYMWAFSEAYKVFHPKHLFISTGTRLIKTETGFFVKLFNFINQVSGNTELLSNSVYVPAPVKDTVELDELFNTGLGMISFNLEVWNPDTFRKYCSGKNHFFSRDYYFKLIKYCVDNFGCGSIKTNFVLGLEDLNTITKGITTLAEHGCFSSGTIFYPTPGAELGVSYQNFDVNYYIRIFKHITEISKKNNLRIPWSKGSRISSLEWDILEYKNEQK